MISPGTYEFGPSQGELHVRTGRSGKAARVGHDLLLAAGKWHAVLVVDPDDAGRSTLTASVDPSSLRVVNGTGGVKPLSDGDREEIASTIARKVLAADRHGEIRFTTVQATTAGNGELTITGHLALAGASQLVELHVTRQEDGAGSVVSTTLAIDQSDFGIKPFSAMMGALKVANQVTVEVSARV